MINGSYLKNLIATIHYDSVSQTNQALVVNNFYLCQKLKKLFLESSIDVNRLWLSDMGFNLTTATKESRRLLLGQIPLID